MSLQRPEVAPNEWALALESAMPTMRTSFPNLPRSSQPFSRATCAGSRSGAAADQNPRRCAAWPITDPNVIEPGEQNFAQVPMRVRGARRPEGPVASLSASKAGTDTRPMSGATYYQVQS
jgi:hypothetical protein